MKVLVLSGKKDCGKTTTLNRLSLHLLELKTPFKLVEGQRPISLRTEMYCLLESSGKYIAITTCGDSPNVIQKNMANVSLLPSKHEINADSLIWITASRDTDECLDIIKDEVGADQPITILKEGDKKHQSQNDFESLNEICIALNEECGLNIPMPKPLLGIYRPNTARLQTVLIDKIQELSMKASSSTTISEIDLDLLKQLSTIYLKDKPAPEKKTSIWEKLGFVSGFLASVGLVVIAVFYVLKCFGIPN